ncbi:MAG TPA: methionine--tRNA ligase [Candidatus Paceibacterota bacterium]
MKNIYITTTLPYVNAEPHIGFAKEIIRADVLARYYIQKGHNVFFSTGTDEHGKKLWEAAEKEGVPVQDYVDTNAAKFKQLLEELGIHTSVHFIRTTDTHHILAAQEFWKRCEAAGYIYKATYNAKYCVGCELEKTDSELVDGRCPLHPNRDLEIIQEENYFFAFSKFQDKLLKMYTDKKSVVFPVHRQKEITSFIERGLQDFSISRSREKMPWGILVPGDDSQVMYVWFDALVNYISTLGWPDGQQFDEFWNEGTTYQFFGKDNLRQQTAMWQSMLLSIGIKPTEYLVDNGFIMAEGGIKMSKSLGNVVAPAEVIEAYGLDALRYMLIRHLSMFEDSDFSHKYAAEWYNAHLVNGIGNLTNRIMKLSETWLQAHDMPQDTPEFDPEFVRLMEEDLDSQKAYDLVFSWIKEIDTYISEQAPFKVVKEDEEKGKAMIKELVQKLYKVATHLTPLIPGAAHQILLAISINTMPATPLFERK